MQEHLSMQQRLVKVAIPLQRAGAKICNQILTNAGMCVYDVELSKAEGVNASADGKKINVTISMMRFIRSDDELAVVIGHELAHNIMGHVAAQTQNAYMGSVVGMMVDTLAASQGIKTHSLFAKNGALQGKQAYSVAFEKEADYVGLYITAIAGYNIEVAPDFWRRMSIKNPEAIVVSSTHPTNPERTVMLEKTIAEIERKEKQQLPLVPQIAPRARQQVNTVKMPAANPYRMTID